MPGKPEFKFRRLDNIGAAAAEEDKKFLENCFVDTGDIDVLRDCSDARRIILGRTGSGKSALLEHLEATEERAIRIEPESLALSYISNSTILNFVSQLGVNLDIFFRLLWRHVFTVELIKRHFKIEDADRQTGFFETVKSLFTEKKHAAALVYLRKWGSTFWEETDYRIRELTTKLEEDLNASFKGKLGPVSISIGGAQKLTEEQRQEVIERAQHVVNTVQIKELSDIMEMLDRALDDPQRRYYLIVDRLDENWIEDKLRYRMVRALIETIRDFRHVRHAKLIVAVRFDLLDRLIRLTRDSGFQEEKYESLYLRMDWTREQLTEILDERINFLVRQRYTKKRVTSADLLPNSVDGQNAIEWILERTMMRPRDLILFFNLCISEAADNPNISAEMLKRAEGEYSRSRMRSLADEWQPEYPNLLLFTEILKQRRSFFRLEEITLPDCEELCLSVASVTFPRPDDLSAAAHQVIEGLLPPTEFRRMLVQVMYRVGLLGLKLASHETVVWATHGRRGVSYAEIGNDTRVSVHPFAWRTLAIRPAK